MGVEPTPEKWWVSSKPVSVTTIILLGQCQLVLWGHEMIIILLCLKSASNRSFFFITLPNPQN